MPNHNAFEISKDHFFRAIERAANILERITDPQQLHQLIVKLDYGYHSFWAFLWYPGRTDYAQEECSHFERSFLRHRLQRVSFRVYDAWRKRSIFWTQTLHRLFPGSCEQNIFEVMCIGGESSLEMQQCDVCLIRSGIYM